MIRFTTALVALVALTSALASASDFSGPISGYALDKESGAIRPINGFPGASLLGAPIELPVILQSAVIRQTQNLAIGIVKESGAIARIGGLTSKPEVTIHDAWLSKCDLIALSATGEFGAAYSKADAKLIRFRNTDLESSIGAAEYGDIVVAAVDQRTVLFASKTHLYRWSGDSVESLGKFDDISGIAFLNEGRDAVVTDAANHSVYLVSDLSGKRETSLLASEKDGVNRPAAVCSGKDNRIVISNSDSTALVIDGSTRSIAATLYLAAKATRCDPLKSDSLLVLNDVGASPLVLVDLAEMTSYFVPVNLQ